MLKKGIINLLKRLENKKVTLRVPLIGLGCGVVGLAFSKHEVKMGQVASLLLRSLEYRGYDSTGAVIQDDKKNITLKKDVGAPSDLVKTLGIENMEGKLFCGQVRWATFGAVDKYNAQPHEVKCKIHMYGAHNGNITNTNQLKEFLAREGHKVASDNDGEMLVHMIEHYFDLNLKKLSDTYKNDELRRKAMVNAILEASNRVEGSYAAVVTDPVTEKMYAIKAGSSLYAGVGEMDGNKYTVVSSDLTSILKLTKNMIQLSEGFFMEFDSEGYTVFTYKDFTTKDKTGKKISFKKGEKIDIPVKRSKLRAEDTELVAPFKFFMHQEIYNQVESSKKLITLFEKGSEGTKKMDCLLKKLEKKEEIVKLAKQIVRTETIEEQRKLFTEYKKSESFKLISDAIHKEMPEIIDAMVDPDYIQHELYSQSANIFLDIIEGKEYRNGNLILAKLLDVGTVLRELDKFHKHVDMFVEAIQKAWETKSNIYTISCGTSYNATKTAALFFNEIAKIKITPILPGNFRGQYSHALRNNDVLIGVSQSGETKDLIDIFNDVINSGDDIQRITIINNENSTLAQEKCDFFLPIKCGPEIAVPATKSYMNQVVLFYFLAIKIAERRAEVVKDKKEKEELKKELEKRYETLSYIPELIAETLRTTDASVDKLAEDLFLEPSTHILATKISSVAEEGALKIRETVLNHTQGIEGSEFKHGPNTILGFNTIFGTSDIESIMKLNGEMTTKALKKAHEANLDQKEIERLLSDITDYLLEPVTPFNISPKAKKIFNEVIQEHNIVTSVKTNYPLIYLTGPDERDVNLTVSQINTHKIRGANTYVIAEENDKLYNNTTTQPSGDKNYRWNYVKLPKTDDTLLSTFSIMVVLQMLAFRMSVKKMKYLNKLHIPMHGVHPDVPKNVSKSITVD